MQKVRQELVSFQKQAQRAQSDKHRDHSRLAGMGGEVPLPEMSDDDDFDDGKRTRLPKIASAIPA